MVEEMLAQHAAFDVPAAHGFIQELQSPIVTTSILDPLRQQEIKSGQRVEGVSFSNSPKMRSIAQIRMDYEAHLEEVQCAVITKILLPVPLCGPRIGINHVGDIHIGTDAVVYRPFKQMLQWILETPDEYLALQGDMIDALTAQSVGVMGEQAITIQDQVSLVIADLEPLARAGKILWILRGNHEDRMDKATKNIIDVAQWIARRLDVPYLSTKGYTHVESGGVSYTSYNIHGFNAGSTAGARRGKMEKMLAKFPSADLITCGHNHHLDVIQVVDEFIDDESGRRYPKARYGLYTGTYHSYLGYAADFGLGQGPLGCGRVEFDVEHGTILPRVLPVVRGPQGYRHILPY